MKRLLLVVVISLALTNFSFAEEYPASTTGMPTQWDPVKGSLIQFIAAGFKLVTVTRSPDLASPHTRIDTITYYLQGDAGLVSCVENYSGGNISEVLAVSQKEVEAIQKNQSIPPLPTPIFPGASFACYKLTLPHVTANPK